jgi:hypothetical protein
VCSDGAVEPDSHLSPDYLLRTERVSGRRAPIVFAASQFASTHNRPFNMTFFTRAARAVHIFDRARARSLARWIYCINITQWKGRFFLLNCWTKPRKLTEC